MNDKIETWFLTDEQRKKFKPLVEDYIARLEAGKFPNVNEVYLELTFQGISPRQLVYLLEELGYIEDHHDHNGWEYDFWIYMNNTAKKKYAKRLCISGCGMAFSMCLTSRVKKDDVEDDYEDEAYFDDD